MSVLLVTGGSGFVLCHLVAHWASLHPAHIAVVVDSNPLDDAATGFLAPYATQIQFCKGDVSDPSFWSGFRKDVTCADEIRFVVHGAAVSSIERHRQFGGLAAALPAVQANIMGTAQALAFAERLPALRRFINVSSGAVYARTTNLPLEVPLPEDGYVAPDGLYPVSKYAAEMLVAQTAQDSGLSAISVRLASVFGPLDRQTPARHLDCIPKKLLMASRDGTPLNVAGLDSVGDYLHASDVASAIVALLHCDTPSYPVYNIAAGALVTLAELLDMVKRIDPHFTTRETTPAKADVFDARPATSGRNGAYDVGRITSNTNWRPADLFKALQSYHEWLWR
jgi:UDP-glucose 4-epimerase